MRRRIYRIGLAEREDREQREARTALISLLKGKPVTERQLMREKAEQRRRNKAINFGAAYGSSGMRSSFQNLAQSMAAAAPVMREALDNIGRSLGERISHDMENLIVYGNGPAENVADRGQDDILRDTEIRAMARQFMAPGIVNVNGQRAEVPDRGPVEVSWDLASGADAYSLYAVDSFGWMSDHVLALDRSEDRLLSEKLVELLDPDPYRGMPKRSYWHMQDQQEARKRRPSYIREPRRPVPRRKFSR